MSADDAPVTITPYEDGPYLVRGTFELRDQAGNRIELRRRTIALCRCGHSRMRPFCDGTHRLVGFRAPGAAEDRAHRPREPAAEERPPRTPPNGHAGGG